MPRLGAHCSTAGGLPTAFDRGLKIGADSIQVFTKSNRQWAARPLTPEEVTEFHARATETGLAPLVCHATYLLNLASPKPDIWQKSLAALRVEIERCRALGLDYLVLHPGAHTGSGTPAGIERVAEALNIVREESDERVMVCLEITAGQGTCLGADFEEFARILDRVDEPERIGICFDTCHALAAGYDLVTPEGYAHTFEEFDRLLDRERLKVFHLNDSKHELGAHRDRHTHIGKGFCGLATFGQLLNDPRFAQHPMLLETPKGDELLEDIVNLRVLRALLHGTDEEISEETLDEFWDGIVPAESKEE
ncbi:MAG: deoxyribonuclease IV [Ardenticatenaceae bacterium]|nr:deoxyribonuclease IV [Ardenticatenaceae bacterium]HBY99509.1 deoxyribonuclease IV [Chloroflexota bacterium]